MNREQVSNKDQRYTHLHKAFYQPVFAYLAHFFPEPLDREDALQETFFTIYKNLKRLDPERAPGPWVYTIARNKALSLLRKRGRSRELLVDPIELELRATQPGQNLDELEWEELMNQLSIPERELAHLRFSQQMTVEEIAGVMNIKTGTVKSRLHHLRKKLGRLMGVPEEKTDGR